MTAVSAERRMAHLVLALTIVVVGFLVLSLVLSILGLSHEEAVGFASIALVLFPPVDQYLEIKEVTVNLAGLPRRRAANLAEFSVPWYVLLAYGAVLLFALHQVTSAIYLIVDDHLQFAANFPFIFSASTGMIIQNPSDLPLIIPPLIGMFFLGRWIAIRSSRHAVPVIIGVALGGHVLALLVGVLTSGDPSAGLPLMSGMMTSSSSMQGLSLWSLHGIFYWVVPTAAAFAAFGLAGWWRGHSQRLMRYADYLLNRLPNDTRLAVVGMLYDECASSLGHPPRRD